jgi:lipid-A-disaccharide synthase
VITFMPGSRKWEIDYMTPFYRQTIELIKAEAPQVRFQVVSSPFVRAHSINGAKTINFEDIHNSELVITIPGTNTAKIAARGIPQIVVFPLNHPEVIPLEGLADLLGKLPVMGKPFKRWVAGLVNKKTQFFALPNQKAGREVAPEIRGVIEPLGVAMKAVELLRDPAARQRMSLELTAALGKPGAAKKIVEEICAGV